MAQDPVLQRKMFNPRDRPARGSGITSTVDDGSSEMTREERLQIAQEMLAQAKMKQAPEYYFNTLAASDRPAMTRPVASSAPPPAMQQMPAAQQMAQMQAAGVRPVGMADGGIVRIGFKEGGPTFTEQLGEYAKMPSDYFRREILGIEDKPEDAPVEPTVDFPDDGVPRDEDGNVLLFDPEGNRLDYFGGKALEASGGLSLLKKLGKPGKSAVKPEDMQDIIDSNTPPQTPSSGVPSVKFGAKKPVKPPSYFKTPKGFKTTVKPPAATKPQLNLPNSERLRLAEKTIIPLNESNNILRGDDKNKGILSLKEDFKGVQPGLSAPYPAASNVSSPENVPKKVEDTDRKQTALEAIKAEREAQKNQNFNMALMQAGLAMMAGKSPNALQNIAEGGISGLATYGDLEKSDRASALDERKMAAYEDSLERKAEYQTSQTARAMAVAKQRGEIEAEKAYDKWVQNEGATFSPEEKMAYRKSLQDRFTNVIFNEAMLGVSSNPLDIEVE